MSSEFASLSSEISTLHEQVQDGLRADEDRIRYLEKILDILRERVMKTSSKTLNSSKGLTMSPSQVNLLKTEREQLTSEVRSLKGELRGMDIVLKQNTQLETEVKRLVEELDEATRGVLYRGYLYKWRDQEISYASKWGLRYFVLKGSSLSYFIDDIEHRPRRTIDLSKCAVRDEGTKKVGQRLYYVFGIYYSSNHELESKQGGVLLRLSTDNRVECEHWLDMLSRACNPDLLSPPETESTPKSSAENQDSNQISLSDNSISSHTLARVESSHRMLILSQSRSYGKSLGEVTALTSGSSKNLTKKKFDPKSFPASKVIHVESKHSPLSAASGEQNYRGFFNLGVIILVISHFRLIFENLTKYGNKINIPLSIFYAAARSDAGAEETAAAATMWWSIMEQPTIAVISWIIPICLAYMVEICAVYKMISENTVLFLHWLLGALNLFVPIIWVWRSTSNPGLCMIYLFESSIIWMKMISYAHVNRDVRRSVNELQAIKAKASLGGVGINNDNDGHNLDYNNDKPASYALFAEMKDLQPPYVQYPNNITLYDIAYFSIAPTLCYQLNYPRSDKVRLRYVVTILVRLLVVTGLILYFVEQYVKPTLESSVEPMRDMNIYQLSENLLKLSIPNSYVWLMGFYWFFHLWLNLLAELTRFGDRLFYKNWWNSRTIDSYWRNWNLPVHNWMLRHLFYPMLRAGFSKAFATFVVFFFSAAFHEIIISIPFRHVSLFAFFGMMLQAPLVFITRYIDKLFDNAFVGNAFFWLVFCVIGQPIGVLMYSYELRKLQ